MEYTGLAVARSRFLRAEPPRERAIRILGAALVAFLAAATSNGQSLDVRPPVNPPSLPDEQGCIPPDLDPSTCCPRPEPDYEESNYLAPPALLNCSNADRDLSGVVFCGRLIDPLREATLEFDPRQRLVTSARLFLEGDVARARAHADLAVSGRRNYEIFRGLGLRARDVLAALAPVASGYPRDQVARAAALALERAHKVAWALRGPPEARRDYRAELGWIAVSGEDDPPDRPVNVPNADPYPQYDIAFDVAFPHRCPEGQELNGELCYPRCRSGFHGAGPACWQDCPSVGFEDAGATCTKHSYGRGVGSPLSLECAAGHERDGLLCYPQCTSGYEGVGPVCWQRCPAEGFTDSGATCTKDSYGRGAGEAMKCRDDLEQDGLLCYPRCKSGYDGVGPACWKDCPATGFTDAGATCTKSSYGRGAGEAMKCAAGLEQDGLLCYPRCRSGFDGVGPVCWQRCPSNYDDHGLTCFNNIFNWFFKSSYGRGWGVPLSECPGMEKDGLLCYPWCNAGYDGVGPVCWRRCPSDFNDFGVGCTKPSYGRGWGEPLSECPGMEKDGALCYPWCREGYEGVGPVCWRQCPSGFPDFGVGCTKPSYGRGEGEPLACADGLERDGLLCYPWCRTDYEGVGPVCWRRCPPGMPDIGTACSMRSYGRGVGSIPPAQAPLEDMSLRIRYLVASRALANTRPVDLARLPADPALPAIAGDIILFIHGLGSRAEEAMDLIPELHAAAESAGRPLTVISLDLPSQGYSTRVEAHGLAGEFPGLDFTEAAILGFVDALELQQPGIKARIIGVIGGSLGGNMGLRLGRRFSTANPWLHHVVAWSPAGVWPSFSELAPCDLFDLECWISVPVRHLALARTADLMNRPEHSHSRNWHFHGQPGIASDGILASSGRWFRPGWPCATAAVNGALRSGEEVYSARTRRWHWRLAHEQLKYSHWAPDVPSRIVPGAAAIRSRLLLCAGSEDNAWPERLYDNAGRLAWEIRFAVEGATLWVERTGHSIHTERPGFFAGQILAFLYQ